MCPFLNREVCKILAYFSDLDSEQRYQLTLLNEVLGIAIVWLNQSTGKSIPEIEQTLLEMGVEQVEPKEYQGIRPMINNLDEVYVEF